ncbi:7066_t:CDS:2, partial [Scutellospora calospora]
MATSNLSNLFKDETTKKIYQLTREFNLADLKFNLTDDIRRGFCGTFMNLLIANAFNLGDSSKVIEYADQLKLDYFLSLERGLAECETGKAYMLISKMTKNNNDSEINSELKYDKDKVINDSSKIHFLSAIYNGANLKAVDYLKDYYGIDVEKNLKEKYDNKDIKTIEAIEYYMYSALIFKRNIINDLTVEYVIDVLLYSISLNRKDPDTNCLFIYRLLLWNYMGPKNSSKHLTRKLSIEEICKLLFNGNKQYEDINKEYVEDLIKENKKYIKEMPDNISGEIKKIILKHKLEMPKIDKNKKI